MSGSCIPRNPSSPELLRQLPRGELAVLEPLVHLGQDAVGTHSRARSADLPLLVA